MQTIIWFSNQLIKLITWRRLWFDLFISIGKRAALNKIRSQGEKQTITIDFEERATPSYLKYAAVIALE
jgi:hypothetical protein